MPSNSKKPKAVTPKTDTAAKDNKPAAKKGKGKK